MLISDAESFLRDLGISLAGAIISMPGIENGIFVPVRVERSSDGTQTPSRKAILAVKRHLEGQGWLAEMIFVDESLGELEQSLRSSLLVNHSEMVRNVFLSLHENSADVWIDAKHSLDDRQRELLSSHVAQFAKLFALPSPRILLLGDAFLPTRTELLGAIRRHAPVNCEELREALVERGFSVPSLDWINRQFDLLRKAELVTRTGERRYILTLNALHRLGTRKSRASPDVRRLLALARGDV